MNNVEPFADQHPAPRRAYVTEDEVDRLIAAARTNSKRGANGERDATMILVCYTHGLRVSANRRLQHRLQAA
jgi:integrase